SQGVPEGVLEIGGRRRARGRPRGLQEREKSSPGRDRSGQGKLRGPLGTGILSAMRVLLVHPSALMYSELYLRLEPIGSERRAASIRASGHEVRLLDLQIFTAADYRAELASFRPQVVGFSMNYLANAPEIIDFAKETKRLLPDCFFVIGGERRTVLTHR